MPIRPVVAFAFVWLVWLGAAAQTPDAADRIRQVEKNLIATAHIEEDSTHTIQERMAFYHIQGLSIAVIHNYKLEWAKGYGWADRDQKIPVTTETLFQAGSISKSLNSVGLLKLAQDKRVDLYADINTYLRSWKFPYDSVSGGIKISIADLLSHTAGINLHGFRGYEKGSEIPTVPEILDGKKPANSRPVRSKNIPGLKYDYSGGGVIISQLIAMDVSGMAYDKYMYDSVLKPFGMTSSTFQQPPVGKNPTIISTAYYANGKEVPGKYHIYPEQAAAGLWTTPTDLSKYIIETQLAYEGRSEKVLNQQMTNLMLTPYHNKGAALGVFMDYFPYGVKYFKHAGVDEGFESHYYGSLPGGNGVVVMVNTENGSVIIPEIINSVAKVYGFKELYRSKVIRPIIADAILQSYVGQYEPGPNALITITKDGYNLFVEQTGGPKLRIFPETESKFMVSEMHAEIIFVKDGNGHITGLVMRQNGDQKAQKIK